MGKLTPGEGNIPYGLGRGHGPGEGMGTRYEFLKYLFLWAGSIGSPLGF